jgi:hypothetical protein
VRSLAIVVPARNAAHTIEETLESVRRQTRTDWQAIVVDDASTDETSEIVRRIGATDPRFLLLSGPGRGPGAARNVGLYRATAPFICFLDADDLMNERYAELMVGALERDPSAAAAYCGWLRLAPDGNLETGPCPTVDDLFERFAAACVFPPNACLTRREVVVEAGGFDEAPTTTEDWDLWQRIARTGARFIRVPDELTIYRMQPGSRSRSSRRVLADGLAVIRQGHTADARVSRPDPAHAAGRSPHLLQRSAFNHLSWAGGMAIAAGEDVSSLFGLLDGAKAPDLDPWEVGGTILEAMRVTLCIPPSQSARVVELHADRLLHFLDELEAHSGTEGLSHQVARTIDVLASLPKGRPHALLRTIEVDVELAQMLADIDALPSRVGRCRAKLTYAGDPIGYVELSVVDGRVTSDLIADAASSVASWRLLERFLACPLSDAAGWEHFVQVLFEMPAPLSTIYDPDAPAASVDLRPRQHLLEVDVSDPLGNVRVDVDSLMVRCTVAGVFLCEVTLEPAGKVVPAGSLRRVMTDTRPDELVRLVAREGIIGWPVHGNESLRARLAARRQSSQQIHQNTTGSGERAESKRVRSA